MISLLDASELIYVGHRGNSPENDILRDDMLRGLPVAGVRYAMQSITTRLIAGDITYVLFDSRTNRKDLFEDYKSSREVDPDIFVQKEMLKMLCPVFGITTVYQDEFEADDLFYTLTYDLVSKDISTNIKIYSGDADVLGTIITPNITRCGIRKETPTVNSYNYPMVVKPKEYIPYNTILAYHMFCGKPSNNIKGMYKGRNIYKDFLEFSEASTTPLAMQSGWKHMALWCKDAIDRGYINKDQVEEIIKRKEVIYPRMNWDKATAIHYGNLNKELAADYAALFGLLRVSEGLKLPLRNARDVGQNRLDTFVRLYRSGVSNIDAGLPADTTFLFNKDNNTSLESQNIGGF